MVFRKKKKMVDVRELQKRGVVRIPRQRINAPTDKDGFVEIGKGTEPGLSEAPSGGTTSNQNFFSFMSQSSSAGSAFDNEESPSTQESDGYSKREVDSKVSDLDNKIYKLEQRVELLERKLDVNQSGDSKVGAAGW